MVRLLWVVAGIEALLIAWLLSQRAPGASPDLPGNAPLHAEGVLVSAEDPSQARDGGSAGVESEGYGTSEHAAPDAGSSSEVVDGGDARSMEKPREQPTLFHGTLRYTNGQPVTRWNAIWLLAEGQEAIELNARPDGTFAAAGLPAGRYRAFAETWGADGTEKTIVLAPGGRIDERFEYKSYPEIPVKILTPNGKRLVEVLRAGRPSAWKMLEYRFLVFASHERPTSASPPLLGFDHQSYGVGHYVGQGTPGEPRWADGRDGTLLVPDRWPLHVSLGLRGELLETRYLTEAPQEIVFRLDEQRFRELLSGVTFEVSGDGPASLLEKCSLSLQSSFFDGVEMHAFEREGNRITIRNKTPGRYALSIWFDKLEDWSRLVELPAGELLDLGRIHLRMATATPLLFKQADGEPMRGVHVRVIDLERGAADHVSEYARSTGPDGGFTFPYAAGRYFLSVVGPDGVFGVDLEVPLPEGAVHEITAPMCHPVNVRLAATLQSPVVVEIFAGDGRRMTYDVESAPDLWVQRLGAGAYTAVATEADGKVHRQAFRASGETVPTVVFDRKAD